MIPPLPPPCSGTLNTLTIGNGHADTLLVLLAGACDRPQDFVSAGFIDALHASARDIDLILVESDLAAVCDGSLPARLEAEVLAPARNRGYRRVLSGGISIGALTALMHADTFPARSDGLVLLAPYPGDRTVTGEIAAAGGVAAWAGDGDYAANDERRGWRALKRLGADGQPPWLGYGSADRFASGHALMAAALPPGATCVLPGGHDWPTWLALWQHWLDGQKQGITDAYDAQQCRPGT